jgi:aryl-phospho-beta-D-glucosidase BglC (GH1 family)
LRRFALPAVLACAVALVLPLAASASSRMYFGFQDDQSFRFVPDRTQVLDRAQATGATVLRVTVEWVTVAPTRPANAADSFDPAYRLDDVDEVVRDAQARGIEVLLTIWGTPSWANGGKGPNFAPSNMNDLRSFARALASRYSGNISGFPYVRFWSVWNESNLEQFLAPQFNAKGKSVAPQTYARLYQAAYSGIKSGNPSALVGIGETSPRGRDKPSPGAAQDSHSPGKFAELVAKANRRLKFDAWAEHPYATAVTARPTQKVKWPNVTLGNLRQFETNLDRVFRRKNIPVWITEYGYQTRPQRPDGVSYSTQSAYAKQAFAIARNDPRVGMFVWFIFRDSPKGTGSQWQYAGGVVDSSNNAKPAFSALASLGAGVDARNVILKVKGGTGNPAVSFPALELKARNQTGAGVGLDYQITVNGRNVGQAVALAPIQKSGWITFNPQVSVSKGSQVRLQVTATDIHGGSVKRTITLVGV